MLEGRSKKAFKDWLGDRDQAWRDGIEVVAMDGFAGFKTATTEELPEAVSVMDPFHVVRLAGDALNECRRRVQQELHGHRGRKGDPLYTARRTLHTGADLLTDKQQARLESLFAVEEHVAVEVTWGIYQRMVTAYRDPDRSAAREQMRSVIDALSKAVPIGLVELRRLGRTLSKRAEDVLAYFDRRGTSNGPQKRSMVASSICEAPLSGSATSPTMSPEHSSRPVGSGPGYTLHCEEPVMFVSLLPTWVPRKSDVRNPGLPVGCQASAGDGHRYAICRECSAHSRLLGNSGPQDPRAVRRARRRAVRGRCVTPTCSSSTRTARSPSSTVWNDLVAEGGPLPGHRRPPVPLGTARS